MVFESIHLMSGLRVYRELASFSFPTALGAVMPITAKYELRHFHPGVILIEVKKELGIQIVVNTTRQHARWSIVHLLLTVVGMIGIVGLFLPFTFGTSPTDAVLNKELWRLALPFFLAVLASAASIRWVISDSFSGRERAIAYVVSASMVGVTLSLWFPFRDGPATIQEWLAFVSPAPVLALGVYFLIRNSRMGPSRKFNPVMAIQIAYLTNAVLCLIAFFGDWQLGAYCVLVAALAFVLQIVLVSAPGIDVVNSW